MGEELREDGSRKERAGAPMGRVLGQGFVYLVAEQLAHVQPQGTVLDRAPVTEQSWA